MRVLAIGNSHISSLEDLLQAHPERRPEGLDLDLVPLNFCYDDHHVIPSGKGTIRFPGLPQMSPLEYDASNYDAIAIIGTFIGGDGIFRSLVARTCFTPLADHQVAALHPSQIVKGQNGKFYNRPPVVAAGDISPGLETHQIVSLECLKALLDFQVQFRLDLLRLDRLASLSPRVLWFESPFPKRSVLLSQWGADYASSSQAAILKLENDASIARSSLPRMCEFHPVPESLTEDGIYLRPEHARSPTLTDIHAGKAFGQFILDRLLQTSP